MERGSRHEVSPKLVEEVLVVVGRGREGLQINHAPVKGQTSKSICVGSTNHIYSIEKTKNKAKHKTKEDTKLDKEKSGDGYRKT